MFLYTAAVDHKIISTWNVVLTQSEITTWSNMRGTSSTTPMLWCYSTAILYSYINSYLCSILLYYIIQKVFSNEKKIKLICYLLKNKATFMAIYWFWISCSRGVPRQGKGGGLVTARARYWLYCPGRARVQKNVILMLIGQICVTWQKQQKWQTV